MKAAPLSLLLLSAAAALANAQTTTMTCTMGDAQRTIAVVNTDQGCEVHYTKPGEEAKTLWHSERAGTHYCDDQAAAFLEKQKGWGWDCGGGDAAAAEPAAAAPEAPAAPAAADGAATTPE